MSIMSDFELSRLCETSSPLRPYVMDPDRLYLSGKVAYLRQLLPRLKSEGHRVLLFSQFKLVLDVLEPFLKLIGLSFLRLDGDTAVHER